MFSLECWHVTQKFKEGWSGKKKKKNDQSNKQSSLAGHIYLNVNIIIDIIG